MTIEQAREAKRLYELFEERERQKDSIAKMYKEGKHEEIANLAIQALGECAANILDDIRAIK